MIDLLAVYICPVHGDVLEDEVYLAEDIDYEHDEIYNWHAHMNCGSEVTQKKVDGAPCFEKVDHERWIWAVAGGTHDD